MHPLRLRKEPPKRPVQEVAPIATRLPPEKMAKAMDMTWESPCHKPTMLGMVIIPPVKMVMTGGWFNYWVCQITQAFREFSQIEMEMDLGLSENLAEHLQILDMAILGFHIQCRCRHSS